MLNIEDQKENKKELQKKNSSETLIIFERLKTIGNITRKYFSSHEDIFKLIGICIALAGLFLNLKSDDLSLKRLIVFFLLISCALVSWFIVKSIFIIQKTKHRDFDYAILLFPIYLGVILIYNFWKYLVINFKDELLFYLHIVGVPLIIVIVNLFSIYFFKLVSKIKTIEGSQLRNFFQVTLSLNLIIAFVVSGYSFSGALKKLLTPEFNNFLLAYLFLLVLLSELRPFTDKTKLRWAKLETIIFTFLVILPFIIHYILPSLIYKMFV